MGPTDRPLAGRNGPSHRRHTGHLEPVYNPIRVKLRRHSKSPKSTKPTGQIDHEVARSRPVHHGLRKTNTRSQLPNWIPRKYPNVPKRTPRRRSRRRTRSTPRSHLPGHKNESSPECKHQEDAQSPPRPEKRRPRTIWRLAKIWKR